MTWMSVYIAVVLTRVEKVSWGQLSVEFLVRKEISCLCLLLSTDDDWWDPDPNPSAALQLARYIWTGIGDFPCPRPLPLHGVLEQSDRPC